jgi:hypothetical protein
LLFVLPLALESARVELTATYLLPLSRLCRYCRRATLLVGQLAGRMMFQLVGQLVGRLMFQLRLWVAGVTR